MITETMISPITDAVQALCLAEVAFNSYIHGFSQGLIDCVKHPDLEKHLQGMAATIHCVNGTQPEEFASLKGDELGLATMDLSERATMEIANVIVSSPEFAAKLMESARDIQRGGHWREEDFTYDCLVCLGVAPVYEFYEEPDITNWMNTEDEYDA